MQKAACLNHLLRRDLDSHDAAIQPTLGDRLADLLVELSERVEQLVDMVAIIGKQRRRFRSSRCTWRYIQRMTPFRQA
jgi:hypothetical protein